MNNNSSDISEKVAYHFSNTVFVSGTIILSKDRLKWSKDYELFLLSLIKRIIFRNYRKELSIDISLNEINSVGIDPDNKYDDLIIIRLFNGKELKFSSSNWKVKDWIKLIEERLIPDLNDLDHN